MNARTGILASLATILWTSPAGAGELHVPGDFPDPQSAIDAALPGDEIIVHGGEWDPIVIHQPLSIIGAPAPLFRPLPAGPFGLHLPLIELAGPGAGRVVLADVRTGGTISGAIFSSMSPSGAGDCFDETSRRSSSRPGARWRAGPADPSCAAPSSWASSPPARRRSSARKTILP